MIFKVIAHMVKSDGTQFERKEIVDTTKEKAFLGIEKIEDFIKSYESVPRWGTVKTEVKICEVVKYGDKK